MANKPIGATMQLQELIKKVREIDLSAAEYLEKEAPKLLSYAISDYDNWLFTLFLWYRTPQGFDYWSNISDLVDF